VRKGIRELRGDIADYLAHKQETWIIFDNLDKGWPSIGLNESDVQIIRCLIEASRKMKNDIRNRVANFYSVVLIRDDIYDLLLAGTPDFGKELRVQLSWRDPDMMRELLRRRFVHGGVSSSESFLEAWRDICVSHVKGEESSQYLIDRTLMRPRNLIKLLHYCRGAAINVGHLRTEADDIEKGLYGYSPPETTLSFVRARQRQPQARNEIAPTTFYFGRIFIAKIRKADDGPNEHGNLGVHFITAIT
jgi:hypothetical protein